MGLNNVSLLYVHCMGSKTSIIFIIIFIMEERIIRKIPCLASRSAVTDRRYLFLYLQCDVLVIILVLIASNSKPDDHQQPGNCSQCNEHDDHLQSYEGVCYKSLRDYSKFVCVTAYSCFCLNGPHQCSVAH